MSWASEQVERYRELEPLYYAFAHRLHDLLEHLVEEEGIYLRHSYGWARLPSDYRTALFRALREGRRLGKRLEEVGDVAGVALVVSTPAAVDAVAEIVERELAIDYSRSLPPAAARAANERNFSNGPPVPRYEHTMYIASLDDTRRELREWSAYADLQLEVHTLTYSQYTWWTTETQHLPFERPSSFPPPAREAFARVARLLADVDQALASEEASRDGIDARYADAIAAGDLDIPLDARGLAVYMRRSQPLADLIAAAVAEGMEPGEEADLDPSAWVLEQELLWVLSRYGIRTIAELDDFLRTSAARAADIFRQITHLSSDQGFVPGAAPESVVTFLVLVLNRADSETVELVEYREELEAALNTLIGNPVAPQTEDHGDA